MEGSGQGRSHGSQGHHLGQLERPPQIGIVLLERLEFVGVEAAVGVHMERRLIEIVGAPPLEGHQLPHRGEVHLEHIAIEGHFSHIGPHVQNPHLGHALLDLPLLLRRHHDMKMNRAAAFLSRHGYRSPRSGASLFGLGGACRPASCICREMEGFRSMRFPTAGLSLEGRSS